MEPNNLSQLAVGIFLVFGRKLIVDRIKDPSRQQQMNSVLKVAGPSVLGCAAFVAVAGLLKR
jgi:hypothetical protein